MAAAVAIDIYRLAMFEFGFQSLGLLSPLQFFFGKGLTRLKLPILNCYREKCMAFPARVGAFIVWADK
jgi:hypothetical protein